MADHLETCYCPCYPTKFDRSRSSYLGIAKGSKKFGDAGVPPSPLRTWLTLLKMFLPLLPCQIRSYKVKPYERNYRHLPEIFDPLRPTFQGHSRSLEPTWIDQLPTTSSVSDHVPIFYRFWDKQRKMQIFPTPREFNAATEGVLCEILWWRQAQKIRQWKRVWRYVHSFRYNTTRVW